MPTVVIPNPHFPINPACKELSCSRMATLVVGGSLYCWDCGTRASEHDSSLPVHIYFGPNQQA